MPGAEQAGAAERARRKRGTRRRRRAPAPLKALLIAAFLGLVVIAGTIAPGWFLSAAVCNAVGSEETMHAARRLISYAKAALFGPLLVAGASLLAALVTRHQRELARVLLLTAGTVLCALAGLWSYRASHRALIAFPLVLVGALAIGHVRRGWNVQREALLLLAAAGLGFAANAVAWATFQKC